MSSKRRDADYLNDILEAMERIITYTSGLSYAQFMEDTRTQDAVLRNIEVIGEAVKRLSPPLRKEVPCRSLEGHRSHAGFSQSLGQTPVPAPLSKATLGGLCEASG